MIDTMAHKSWLEGNKVFSRHRRTPSIRSASHTGPYGSGLFPMR